MPSWEEDLLQGVEKVPLLGIPGKLIVVREKAEPILTGTTPEDAIMAAAEYGTGRVIAFSHDSYVLKFHQGDPNFSTLNSNISRWLTKDWHKPLDHVDLGGISNSADLPAPGSCILFWHLDSRDPSEDFTEAVVAHIQYGGFLVCGVCPWGWLQLNPGKTLADMPHSPVLARLGLSYIEGYVQVNGSDFRVSENMAANAHAGRAILDVSRNLNMSEFYGGLLAGMALIPRCFRSALFRDDLIGYFNPAQLDGSAPSKRYPADGASSRARAMVLGAIYRMAPPQAFCKLPGIDIFPGDFESKPDLQTVELSVKTKYQERLSTGFYVPAGQPIKITCAPDTDIRGWRIRIGAHSDKLGVTTSWRRWPDICVVEKLEMETVLSSPFGGLLYFERDAGGDASLAVTVHNVVEAPYVDLTQSGSLEDWPRRGNAPGLWAELAGKHIIFTVPSSSVRHIEDPASILALWDVAVKAQHDLRGTDAGHFRRERVVADEQPSVGYMHAGYPIVTQLDVVDPSFVYNGSDNFIFSETGMKQYGNWGLFHELGHNMQRESWTFSGLGEVTNNIFTLYTYEVETSNRAWDNPTMKRLRSGKLESFLEPDPSFADWKKDPFFTLCVYSQLARVFGWESFKKVFRMYETSVEAEKENAQDDWRKIDLWFARFSNTVRHNLSPMCDFWGIPLSENVKRELGRLHPAFLPKDEITELGQSRVERVLQNYPDNVRVPAWIPK